jgi:hypothetical protein
MSLALGDFNRDGCLDIVVANNGMGNVGVLICVGNGSFGEQTTFSTGNNSCPSSVAVGDFNSDGKLDLTVAVMCTNMIGVLLGNGDGAFGAQITVSTDPTTIATSVAVGDFNGDGHLDIVATNEKFLSIGVLLGNGNGTFRTETMFSTGAAGYPNMIACGDFNEDGSLDLASSNGVLDNVAVLLNNGNGYFGVSMTFSTGKFSNSISIATGDFDNDERLDLAVANCGTSNVGIMFGTSDGVFEAQMTFSTGTYSCPNSIVVGDFNNDRYLDIAVSNSYAQNVGVLLGIGNRSFLPQMTFSTGSASILTSITSGDFNNDGKLDLAITDQMQNSVDILLNTCDCC